MKLKKVTKNMLLRRGINLNRYQRKVVTNVTELCGMYESFTKKDLRDDGYYEITDVPDYDGERAAMCHIKTELETDEQFARRICEQHDNRKK